MINLLDVQVGDRISLTNGAIVEVVENIGDGQWLMVRGAEPASDDELCHAADMVELVD